MANENNKRALKYAHILHSHKPHHKWSDIVRYGWYFVKFRSWLSNHVVKFSYFKQDGSIREAMGTTNTFFIPFDKRPKGDMSDGMGIEQYKTIPYFDLDKKEWRSFKIVNFIGYVELFPKLER